MTDADDRPTKGDPSDASDGSRSPDPGAETPEPWSPALVGRCVVGGVFMGAANLVPGISGGTMLVAVGIYRRFVVAIADLSRGRLRSSAMGTIGLVVLGAVIAFVGLAGVVSIALSEFRWGMYALFIGLTLGGAPVLWGMMERNKPAAWGGVVLGFVLMAALTFVQSGQGVGAAGEPGLLRLFIGGVAGASAMILPGVSGAYLLLLLGLYETLVGAIKDFVSAGASFDVAAAMGTMRVLVPVGVGVLVGIAVVSTALKWLLRHATAPTIGCLLGLLLASPLGLYPFREAIEPKIGDVIGGEMVTEQTLPEILEEPKDWPQQSFTPSAGHLAGAAGLIGVGFVLTLGISRLGRGKDG